MLEIRANDVCLLHSKGSFKIVHDLLKEDPIVTGLQLSDTMLTEDQKQFLRRITKLKKLHLSRTDIDFDFSTQEITILTCFFGIKDYESILKHGFFPNLKSFEFGSTSSSEHLESFITRHKNTLKVVNITGDFYPKDPLLFSELKYLVVDNIPVGLNALSNLIDLSVYGVEHTEAEINSFIHLMKVSSNLASVYFAKFPHGSTLQEAIENNTFLRYFYATDLSSDVDETRVKQIVARNRDLFEEAATKTTLLKALASFKLKQHKDVLDCIARELFMIRKVYEEEKDDIKKQKCSN
jgi:hypothetical protein